jgi:hypothetical protein
MGAAIMGAAIMGAAITGVAMGAAITGAAIMGAAITGGGHHWGGHHRGWHHWGYGSGIYFDVSPHYVAPAPYIGVTPEPPAMWYYCTDPPGYYPTVPTCNVPWTLVYSQG